MVTYNNYTKNFLAMLCLPEAKTLMLNTCTVISNDDGELSTKVNWTNPALSSLLYSGALKLKSATTYVNKN